MVTVISNEFFDPLLPMAYMQMGHLTAQVATVQTLLRKACQHSKDGNLKTFELPKVFH